MLHSKFRVSLCYKNTHFREREGRKVEEEEKEEEGRKRERERGTRNEYWMYIME